MWLTVWHCVETVNISRRAFCCAESGEIGECRRFACTLFVLFQIFMLGGAGNS